MSNIHNPETAFAIATGLRELISLAARQGEAINALLGSLAHDETGPMAELDASLTPQSLLPSENLLLLAAELKVVAQRIRVRSGTLRRVQRNSARDAEPDVSRETSQSDHAERQRRPRTE